MHVTIRLKLFALLTLAALALAGLPSADPAARPAPPQQECPPALAYKSCLGLMPPVYGMDPRAPSLQSTSGAPDIPFLKPAVSMPTGSWPQVLATADLAHTGHAAAAVATERYFDPANDRQLQLFNMPSSAFARAQRLPAGAGPAAVVALDTNLDGRPEVVAALAGENALAVYRPGVAATQPFSGALRLPAPGAPDALAVGDFDGDLRDDLAAAAPLSDTIHFWRSSPQGLVPLPLALPHPTHGFDALVAGDFNNDGQDDLAALRGSGYQTGSVVVYLQRSGAFPTSYVLSPQTGGYLPNSLAAGDLNGDGLDDLAVTSRGNTPAAYLDVFLQNGGVLVPSSARPAFHLPGAVATGDINHDGREDVVVAHDAWRTLSVYTQAGGGALAPYAAADIPYSSRYRPNALALADFNGDGGMDVALVGHDTGLTVLMNRIAAPIAAISQPLESAILTPGMVLVPGTASATTARVQVRIRGLTGWTDASLSSGVWRIGLALPALRRSWWIEARAIDAQGHVQAPPAHRRVRVETFCYEDNTPGAYRNMFSVKFFTIRRTGEKQQIVVQFLFADVPRQLNPFLVFLSHLLQQILSLGPCPQLTDIIPAVDCLSVDLTIHLLVGGTNSHLTTTHHHITTLVPRTRRDLNYLLFGGRYHHVGATREDSSGASTASKGSARSIAPKSAT